MKQTLKLFILLVLAVGAVIFFKAPDAHAATIPVIHGYDETSANTGCSLSEAIISINDGNNSSYPECTSSNANPFGTDDTIELPGSPYGTITLIADLPQITEPVTIEGQGMGKSIIDGDGQWRAITVDLSSGNFQLTGVTIKAFSSTGLKVQDAEITSISQVEVDGTGAVDNSMYSNLVGLGVYADTAYENTVNLSDIYIHDFDLDVDLAQIFLVGSSNQSEMNVFVDRATIAHIYNRGMTQAAVFGSLGLGPVNGNAPFTANVSNITVQDIRSATLLAIGVGVANVSAIGVIPVLNLANATVDKVESASGLPATIPAIAVTAAAQYSGDVAHSQLNVTNVMVSRSSLAGSSANCGVLDISMLIGGAGTGTGSITSHGGNLSDDTTCEDYFTVTGSDQNNVGTLSSTLGALSNNGGHIPTIPLLAGSPAIDAGVTVSGFTTDARLTSRPQGTAFDSGAYEAEGASGSLSALANTGQSVQTYLLIATTILASGGLLLAQKRLANRG